MKVRKIKVPFYKWKIKVVLAENHDDKDAVLKEGKAFRLTPDYLDMVETKFDGQAIDGADIFCNSGPLLMLIIAYPHSNTLQLVSTLIHEGRHASDTIIKDLRLEGDEAAAYLNEYITLSLIKDYIKE